MKYQSPPTFSPLVAKISNLISAHLHFDVLSGFYALRRAAISTKLLCEEQIPVMSLIVEWFVFGADSDSSGLVYRPL